MPQREHRELEAIPHVAFVVDGGEHVLHGLLGNRSRGLTQDLLRARGPDPMSGAG